MQKHINFDLRDATDNWVSLLQRRALDTPEKLAFGFAMSGIDNEIQYTYAALDYAARRIGAALQQAGMQGKRVVLIFPPGPDYVCALLGCFYAGAVAVPVYAPRQNASLERVIQITTNSQAAMLLSTTAVLANVNAQDLSVLSVGGIQWLATDALDAALADQWTMPTINAETLAVLQYTSGSTGRPKGVQLRHQHLLTNTRMIGRAMGCGPDTVCVMWVPPYHDMGLVGGLLQPLYSGYPVHLMAPVTFLQRPIRWLEAISKHRATISAAPNFAYDLCVKRVRPEDLAALDLSSWKVAINGAEPIRAQTLRNFADMFSPVGFDARAFFPSYGMAETTLYVCGAGGIKTRRLSREALALGVASEAAEGVDASADVIELVSCGRPDPEVALHIVDTETEQICPDGQVGEVWISGATVAAGYWNGHKELSPEFEAQIAGSADKFLRTGDVGCLIDGELYVTGRIKDLIIIHGQNHYPHDVEATVEGIHPALRAHGAVAFGVDSGNGEQLVLILEIERGYLNVDFAPVEVAVRDAVSRQHQLHVERIVFIRPGGLPRTSSGKLQRRLTRQRLQSGELPVLLAELAAECERVA
jgi:acyl-CoA synthetase (AMP-forming)/AMP-acid ligase II